MFSVCITDTKPPLSKPFPQMALLKPKVPFWVFACACSNPYFCSSVWRLCVVTKQSAIFQKQIVATKMWFFANFLKYAFLTKKSSQPPKKHIFLVFFPFFHLLSLSFSNKKDKKNKKKTFFVRLPFCDTSTCKKHFRTPTHYLCFLRCPKKNTLKLGQNKPKQF